MVVERIELASKIDEVGCRFLENGLDRDSGKG